MVVAERKLAPLRRVRLICLLGIQVAVERKPGWMVLAIDNYDYGIF